MLYVAVRPIHLNCELELEADHRAKQDFLVNISHSEGAFLPKKGHGGDEGEGDASVDEGEGDGGKA